MRISKVEFENFRNFKDRNVIKCSTDGKVTIVYGDNGVGKTTLHQLFYWLFYNDVNFNSTTTKKMYNMEREKECNYGDTFSVWGNVEFEHAGEYYSLRREWVYKVELDASKKVSEDLSIHKKSEDSNWDKLSKPEELIEDILPSGLSEYFFFDGESMIADLAVKGKESANKLRRALYSMFDLDILEMAVSHIGTTELKTTALGQLYLSKANAGSDQNIEVLKSNVEQVQGKIKELEQDLTNSKIELKEKSDFIKEASEVIGSTKSKQDYEKQRKNLKTLRDNYLSNESKLVASFGEEIIRYYPKMLMAQTLKLRNTQREDDKKENPLVPGLKKPLISYLLKSPECICGRPMEEAQYARLAAYFDMMPPKNYRSTHETFVKMSESWMREYDGDKMTSIVEDILDNRKKAANCDKQIIELDKEEKGSDKSIQKWIDDRYAAERRVKELNDHIEELNSSLTKFNALLKNRMKQFSNATDNLEQNKLVNRKIEILQSVKDVFETKLNEQASEYSKLLQLKIQDLLDKMLTSKRNVTVSPDFFVRVFDSYDDESKSEGQFAVVSYAYIGGILNLLKSIDGLKTKEYPLVLDGPFSKLDNEHRQNVIDVLPEYAPQIILFSKDDLQDYFDETKVGYVWSIQSNDEKNVASVKEGTSW